MQRNIRKNYKLIFKCTIKVEKENEIVMKILEVQDLEIENMLQKSLGKT
jgi:hypothetical protein